MGTQCFWYSQLHQAQFLCYVHSQILVISCKWCYLVYLSLGQWCDVLLILCLTHFLMYLLIILYATKFFAMSYSSVTPLVVFFSKMSFLGNTSHTIMFWILSNQNFYDTTQAHPYNNALLLLKFKIVFSAAMPLKISLLRKGKFK